MRNRQIVSVISSIRKMSDFGGNRDEIPKSINFAETSEKILQYWNEIDAFQTSLKLSEGRPEFSFYDGPPFATGLPHYGHILAGTIKDIVTRYAHSRGYHVTRRFGWDCHGLPVEHEIDKTLNIRGPNDVLKMGIKQYNDACRSIVSRYSHEWESIVSRFGRWIDFKNDYKTMYPSFMESVWWVFKQCYEKGLVYKSKRVMPYSTACHTPLSNFETSQNYKDVVDPSIIVKFKICNEENSYFLAWTTTPWTLPCNMALVVHPDLVYARVIDTKSSEKYTLMESRLCAVYKNAKDYQIIDKFPGKRLIGTKYTPIFDYLTDKVNEFAFHVYADTYVTDQSGTGIVHSAPAFGEDDLRVCKINHVFEDINSVPCPVDESGCYTDLVTDFSGVYVKEADSKIIKHLKSCNSIVLQTQHKHSYPFCWRSDTPIIYRLVPSWFLRVETLIPKLLENNKKSRWVPEYVRDRRFHNWLSQARDWNLSRNRFWGTPIPIWTSSDGEEVVCVGSVEELYQLSGVKVADLHREHIDDIIIPSKQGKGDLRRVSEVFDCWFESGSMPYAQVHYPFENKDLFSATFPADFVAEGIDQTRGWFYTLLVLSTAVFDQPPFKNLIVNGLILASDGQKMSKRKKNYPDPVQMLDKYGADCLRAYLINSPAVNGDNLCFKESGLIDITKEFFLPWFNAFRYFLQNKAVYEQNNQCLFSYNEEKLMKLESILDKWILSCSQSLIINFRAAMDAYQLYGLLPHLQEFVDKITKWYIRQNRCILRGDSGSDAQITSLTVLFHVLYTLAHVSSSVCPFLAEYYYQRLKFYVPGMIEDVRCKSIHFQSFPESKQQYILPDVERSFSRFCRVVELCRKIRERRNLAMKHPLKDMIVIHPDVAFLEDVRLLEPYMLQDLNLKSIVYESNPAKYNLKCIVEPNYSLLGKKYRSELKSIIAQVNELSQETLFECLQKSYVSIGSHEFSFEEVRVSFHITDNKLDPSYDFECHKDLSVLVNIVPSKDLEKEGLAREFVNRLQRLRKTAGVNPVDDITITYEVIGESCSQMEHLLLAISENNRIIQDIVKQPVLPSSQAHCDQLQFVIEDKCQVAGVDILLRLYR